MAKIAKTRRFLQAAPREALTDALGFGAMCLLILVGFTAPALL